MRGPTFFKGYVPSKNDVFVATQARSGTNWMMQISLQIIHHGQAEYEYIYDMIPWPDFFLSTSIALDDPQPPSPTGLRVIKTHLEAPFVPVNDAAKYICVIRDPKEFFVSTYHFFPQTLGNLGLQQPTPDEWYELFMSNLVPLGSWLEHTASWWALRHKPNVMIIPFHKLKADMEGHIDQLATFLGVELTAEARTAVIEKSSFAYMRQLNHKLSPIVGGGPVIEIVRKGQADGGRELLDAKRGNALDAYCKQELQRLGSDFPFDEFFAHKEFGKIYDQ
ncbi:sulfotransferase domain-containing protein [Candidatus Leptofilum sp.]|uniref:sulfotransferase domain-containing protein n=1 Tax=Candidatus Leptofilum sp. TaxID=3241576 RepID=UPI003B598B29